MSILLFEEVQALEQASFQGKGGIHFLLNASDKDIHSQHLWVTFKIIFISMLSHPCQVIPKQYMDISGDP